MRPVYIKKAKQNKTNQKDFDIYPECENRITAWWGERNHAINPCKDCSPGVLSSCSIIHASFCCLICWVTQGLGQEQGW